MNAAPTGAALRLRVGYWTGEVAAPLLIPGIASSRELRSALAKGSSLESLLIETRDRNSEARPLKSVRNEPARTLTTAQLTRSCKGVLSVDKSETIKCDRLEPSTIARAVRHACYTIM